MGTHPLDAGAVVALWLCPLAVILPNSLIWIFFGKGLIWLLLATVAKGLFSSTSDFSFASINLAHFSSHLLIKKGVIGLFR